YYFLLRGWLDLFGSASIETARAFSAVCGALGVPAVWLLARTLGLSPRVRWLARLLVAVSPPLVYLGQEARVFALFATVTTLAIAAAARVQQTDKFWAWLAFVAAGAVLVHLHYYAFFVLFLLGLDLLAWAWPRGWAGVPLASAGAGPGGGAAGVAGPAWPGRAAHHPLALPGGELPGADAAFGLGPRRWPGAFPPPGVGADPLPGRPDASGPGARLPG